MTETENLEALEAEFGRKTDFNMRVKPASALLQERVRIGYRHFLAQRGLRDHTMRNRIDGDVRAAKAAKGSKA